MIPKYYYICNGKKYYDSLEEEKKIVYGRYDIVVCKKCKKAVHLMRKEERN